MIVEKLELGPLGANTYVITDEASGDVAVVDCGGCTAELLKKFEGRELKYILLTHGHADHILGAFDLKKAHPEASVVIHRADAICLTDKRHSLVEDILPGAQKDLTADILVDEGDELPFGNDKIEVMHTPGHTGGSVCYLAENERKLFTGDTLFCLTTGRTDLFGGDEEAMYTSIKRLYEMEGEYEVYPGHNRATTLDYERRRNRYMRRFK